MLLAATTARAFDFMAQTSAGQWLYYTVIGEDTVKLVNPNWDSHVQPSGVLQIPAMVTNNNINYHVTAIDENAFRSCSELTLVIIPEGITSIGRMAFAYCTALDSIVLPSTLTYIGSMAFTSTAFFSGDHLTAEGLLIAGDYLIGARTNLTGIVTVPEGIQGLGNMAFYACGNLDRVILPSGLRFIGENAFQDCLNLDTLELREATPPSLASNAFTHAENTVILVPCNNAEAYLDKENWSDLIIVEHCPAGIPQPDDNKLAVTITDGGIIINGNSAFTVSDIMGRQIAECNGGFVALPKHGIYFVSTPGMKSAKVVY